MSLFGKMLLSWALVAMGLAYGQPKATIAPSPHPSILLTPVRPPASSDPVLSSIFAGLRSAAIPVSFYLTNQSDQPVVALRVAWIMTDAAGNTRNQHQASDIYDSNRNPPPVIKPGDRILVAPGAGWAPDSMLPTYAASGNFSAMDQKVSALAAASSVVVSVDAVIFGNGEIAGPDKFGLADDLTARKQAADAIVAALDAAKVNSVAPAVALDSMVRPKLNTSHLGIWEQTFANIALKVPGYADSHLRRLPAPPVLWRASATPAN